MRHNCYESSLMSHRRGRGRVLFCLNSSGKKNFTSIKIRIGFTDEIWFQFSDHQEVNRGQPSEVNPRSTTREVKPKVKPRGINHHRIKQNKKFVVKYES
jgi:hypothetical protein